MGKFYFAKTKTVRYIKFYRTQIFIILKKHFQFVIKMNNFIKLFLKLLHKFTFFKFIILLTKFSYTIYIYNNELVRFNLTKFCLTYIKIINQISKTLIIYLFTFLQYYIPLIINLINIINDFKKYNSFKLFRYRTYYIIINLYKQFIKKLIISKKIF